MDRCKAPGVSGGGRELGGCSGEEWPHTQSILREKQGCQEGPPWVWLSVSPHRLLPGGAGQRGPSSLLVLLLSRSKLLTERSWVLDGGG